MRVATNEVSDMKYCSAFAAFVAAAFAACLAGAQDLRGSPPLPSLPQVYETSEHTIRVVEVANGLANPWSLAFLPNGDMLVTERAPA
jgi:glucose/arabinose dehydrogenase